MNKKRKKLWDVLMTTWREDKIACRLHYARAYVAAYPDDMCGWIALADILSGMAFYKEAHKALRMSLKLCPKEEAHQVHMQMGRMYREKCDLKKAEKWFRKAIDEHPQQEYLVFLAGCLVKQGRHFEAKSYYQQAVQMCPETADEAYCNLGLISRVEGNNIEALDYFNKAIEIDPDDEVAIFARQDIEEVMRIIKKENHAIHANLRSVDSPL